MRRREFITLVGGAAAWPLAARAQQPAMAVIGFLGTTSPDLSADFLRTFRQALKEAGFVEGENVAMVYRWAGGQVDRLPELAAELVQRRVTVLITGGDAGALAAKAATQTIPIVFMQGAEPVRIGLVGSLNRPGGNLTGIDLLLAETAGKRLGFLLDLVPAARLIAYLRNPTNPVFAESETREVEAAARGRGVQLLSLNASSLGEIDAAFAELVRQRANALQVSSDGFFLTHPDHIVALAARHAIPAIYAWRQAMPFGGLMSYGTSILEAWRQAGVYTSRILKGEKPVDLPVQRVSKIEMIINLKTAKALGIKISDDLVSLANEVIE